MKHEHEWQVAVKPITVDNDGITSDGDHVGDGYTGPPAWFKVRYCPKCKKLDIIDYWIGDKDKK